MLQLENNSPFAASLFVFPDHEGIDSLFVVVKGTFSIGASEITIAAEPRPVTVADEHWGEPGESSLEHAAEAHVGKLGTDVVVLAEACAPGERPVPHVDVSVQVADRRKDARVYGERYWTEGVGGVRPSKPKPLVQIPVTWERTYGGKHVLDATTGEYLAEPRNPVGRGFLGKRTPTELLGQPAPNVEDPRAPFEGPSSRGRPVGFGPVAPSWAPRAQHAGTYDEAWTKTRAPYLPRDFDRRFFHAAPEELVFPQGLQGGEPVALLGLHPRGLQRFDLPRCVLGLDVTVAGKKQRLPCRLETVLLEPTDERFSLSFRASLAVDKRMLKVERVEVTLERIEGVVAGQLSA